MSNYKINEIELFDFGKKRVLANDIANFGKINPKLYLKTL